MRVVLLCGNQSNQHALVVKASEHAEIAGIVLETRIAKRKPALSSYLSRLAGRLLSGKISASWQYMLAQYNAYTPQLAPFRTLHTADINAEEVLGFIRQLKPDLVMVSGTSLIREQLLELKPPEGIINLHTGLSPYVKGGPNCTNWCIANNTMHLVGNTVMWLDKGIDSGNIITTETTPLNGNESLGGLHVKVMEHAHSLYIRALSAIINNSGAVPSVKQSDIAKGELYLSKMWDLSARRRFMKNVNSNAFQKQIKSEEFKQRRAELKLISLP